MILVREREPVQEQCCKNVTHWVYEIILLQLSDE